MTYSLVLQALADPTRRALFERLHRKPHTVGELAELVQVRQPTVSQHLRVLRAARLVTDQRDGTRRYYSARQDGLVALRKYVESFWDDVLAAFAADDPVQQHPAVTATPARAKRRRVK